MNSQGGKRQEGRPLVAAYGGLKGGVGRSTLVAETALSLGRAGFRVLCIDASWTMGGLARLLHARPTDESLHDPKTGASFEKGTLHVADLIQETDSNNVWAASLFRGRSFPFEPAHSQVDWFFAQLYQLEFDWVLLDLSSAIDGPSLGLFVAADVPILVATPEPASLQLSVHYFRQIVYRMVKSLPQYATDKELWYVLENAGGNFSLEDLIRFAPSRECRDRVLRALDSCEFYTVFNFVREGSERDLGSVIGYAIWKELGIFVRNLGSVDYEDRRWFYNRRSTAKARVRGEDAISEDIEKIVRNLSDMETFDRRFPRPQRRNETSNPLLQMGLAAETKRGVARQHTRKIWEGFRRERVLDDIFSSPTRRKEIISDLENVYQKILSMDSTRGHDVTTPPSFGGSSAPPPSLRSLSEGRSAETVNPLHEKPPLPTSSPLTGEKLRNSPGAIIGELRKDRGMTIQQLSQRTHIGIKILTAIEAMNVLELPRDVYLRGYLREIARTFDIDPNLLIQQYILFLAENFEW